MMKGKTIVDTEKRSLPGNLWRGDQDAPELLKLRKDKNKSEKVHGRMRAFGNNNERSQRSGAKRKGQALRIPDADQGKHRLSVATFQNHE